MFESAELGHQIDKDTYKAEEPELRSALLNAQFELVDSQKFAVVVLVGGVDGAGKGETVNLLNEWMDPRHIQVNGMGRPSDEEQERPHMWRFWRALPPRGKIGIFFGSWYTQPILEHAQESTSRSQLDQSITEINHFERMLAAEGVVVIKFWFHMSKAQQKERLKALAKDPATRWRVTDQDWKRFKRYDQFREASEYTLRQTSRAEAPWIVVEGSDRRYRNITVSRILLNTITQRLADDNTTPINHAAPLLRPIDDRNIISSLELDQELDKKTYKQELEKYQGQLNQLARSPQFREQSLVLVFEGSDAAGKGGCIRRVTAALDARFYRVIPIAAPTEEERLQPYLWRFWRQLPRQGQITIFDRSWYGRVLVERVEGFCSEADWLRAYSEIADFEQQLVQHQTFVAKFWLAISNEEQLVRFKEREQTSFKRFKITPEDWRNREKWDDYERAVCDMVDRTSTAIAPWTLVEANNKYYARIKVLKTICNLLTRVCQDDDSK
ncbi:MAG: polyphosphate:AMP phosphotransferase [Cyanobacteria bacterium P01_H01_bin.121]